MRTKLLQALAAAIFAAAAVQTGLTLTDHHVPVTYVVTSITTMLLTGINFLRTSRKATTYTCPEDCGLSITTTNQDPQNEQSMRDLATNHSLHR
jgi:hypothetical protein